MASLGGSEEDVEQNIHDEAANSERSTVDTSSTDTHTILGRNRLLRNVVKELQKTFHMYKGTMEELIVKPVMFLEKQTHNDISAAKGQLKESEGILKQAVILLIDGVETMKEAMNKHSRKIDELLNYEECSIELASDILSSDFKTPIEVTMPSSRISCGIYKCADIEVIKKICDHEVQNSIEHHDEIGRFYHVENQKHTEIQKPYKCCICNDIIRENRLMLGISMSYHSNCFRCCTCNKCLDGKPFTLFEGDLYCIDDFYRNFPLKSVFSGQGSKLLQSKTVKRSANPRYSVSANGKPLNPIPSNSPSISSIGFMVGKRMQTSSFVMHSDERPGTTSSQKMIGNYRRQLSPLSKSKSSKSKLQELGVKNKNRGKGMTMQGVRSDLRIRSETGPRKPEDLKPISDPKCVSLRPKTL